MLGEGQQIHTVLTLDFYQIYFKDEQKDKLYDFAIPHKNETLTPYFENQIIAELVPKATADLVSVCSWRLAQKRGEGPSEAILKRAGTFLLTKEAITGGDYDVAILTPRTHKDIIEKFIIWHGDAGRQALATFRQFIRIPDTVEHAIYENHFIARREIYQEYVTKCLIPAIEFMSTREVFSLDSGYILKKRNPEEIKEYQQKSGRKDWPIAPFVLERLFSIWANRKGFKYVNL